MDGLSRFRVDRCPSWRTGRRCCIRRSASATNRWHRIVLRRRWDEVVRRRERLALV